MSETLADFIERYGITSVTSPAGCNPNMADRDWPANHYRVTLARDGAEPLSIPFSCGVGITEEPGTADVLDCLASDASMAADAGDVLDFASECGFPLDSHEDREKARRTFEAIQAQTAALREFLPSEAAYEELVYETERL